ncbi:hypothetical protein E2C01_075273 [Portunus trituberculatus]|uniref:Uncharacterized protein n=1 Tax=Portunus trituberculatus TaxID=210409 RepID=A0A5B7IGN3_PORTR|nr:hypothetical protein [Portunus trituberculatus]
MELMHDWTEHAHCLYVMKTSKPCVAMLHKMCGNKITVTVLLEESRFLTLYVGWRWLCSQIRTAWKMCHAGTDIH